MVHLIEKTKKRRARRKRLAHDDTNSLRDRFIPTGQAVSFEKVLY